MHQAQKCTPTPQLTSASFAIFLTIYANAIATLRYNSPVDKLTRSDCIFYRNFRRWCCTLLGHHFGPLTFVETLCHHSCFGSSSEGECSRSSWTQCRAMQRPFVCAYDAMQHNRIAFPICTIPCRGICTVCVSAVTGVYERCA
jgi:hypothetical protein